MSLKELETRVLALERVVAELQLQVAEGNGSSSKPNGLAQQKHWWKENAGAFKDDPGFEEMVRLGREYRKSLYPGRQKVKQRRKLKNADT